MLIEHTPGASYFRFSVSAALSTGHKAHTRHKQLLLPLLGYKWTSCMRDCCVHCGCQLVFWRLSVCCLIDRAQGAHQAQTAAAAAAGSEVGQSRAVAEKARVEAMALRKVTGQLQSEVQCSAACLLIYGSSVSPS